MIFFAVVALIHLIKPIGWPGLRHRRDAWKLAVAGFFIVVVLVSLRPEGGAEIPANEPQAATPAGDGQ